MKNTNIFLALVMFSFALSNDLIGHNWQWAKHIGSNMADGSSNIATDSYGNVYCTGFYDGFYCLFTNDSSGIVQGDNDIFFVKYDNGGNEIWHKQFGVWNTNNCPEAIGGMAIDNNNNIYITGSFCGTLGINFGTCHLGGGMGGSQIFLTKFDINGNCVWAKSAGGQGNDGVSSMTLDSIGNIYLWGENTNSATFDTINIPQGVFIAKYDSNGNCLWAKKKFDSGFNYGFNPSGGIKVMGSNIFVSGNALGDTLIVDTITKYLPHTFYPSFLCCLDTSGTAKWLKFYDGPNGASTGWNIGIDSLSNCYVTGTFGAQGIFDDDTLNNTNKVDAYLAKYDVNGNYLWAKQLHATNGSWGVTLATDKSGYTYLTGRFSGDATFGSNTITSVTSSAYFIARYDYNGTCLGATQLANATGTAVCIDGNTFLSGGSFGGTTSIGSDNFTSYGGQDVFIAKGDAITGFEEEQRIASNQLTIYANPTTAKCNVSIPDEFLHEKKLILRIFDSTGRLIQQKALDASEGKVKLNLEAEAKGIYNVTLSNGKKSYGGKIVFQ